MCVGVPYCLDGREDSKKKCSLIYIYIYIYLDWMDTHDKNYLREVERCNPY